MAWPITGVQSDRVGVGEGDGLADGDGEDSVGQSPPRVIVGSAQAAVAANTRLDKATRKPAATLPSFM